jgi:cell division topological specificity factor
MNLLHLFQRRSAAPAKRSSSPEPTTTRSASAARDRLTILLAHERAVIGRSELVQVLREEILAAIAKHVTVERDKVQVKMEGGEGVSTLAIDIEIPAPSAAQLAA